MTEDKKEDLQEKAIEQTQPALGNLKKKKPKATANTVKPPKKPSFRRGSNVLCLLVTPGESKPELLKLRKTEDLIIDKKEDRSFTVSTGPALEIINKNKNIDCYVLDAHKGCTVDLDFKGNESILEMKTNPETTYDLIDGHLISQFVDLKPDWKQSAGMALGAGLLAFMFGLMF
jgi:hypothetical protein